MPDLNLVPYSYTEQGRRPVTWAAAAASLAVLLLALIAAAPWYFYPPLCLALGGSLYMVLRNPASGTRLTPDTWSFHGAGFDRAIAVASIDHVSITYRSDDPESVRIHMLTGEVVEPPSPCLPSAEVLKAELARARIPVREA